MKKDTCSNRLKYALKLRNVKQSDLSKHIHIPKSAISQYISGKFEPKQDRVEKIATFLDVSEAWLMGYDVPIERQSTIEYEINNLPLEKSSPNYISFSPDSSLQTQTLLVFNKNGIAGGHEKIIPSDDVLNEINKLAQALKPYPAEQINALLKIVENGGNVPVKADMPQELKELISATANLSKESIVALIQVAKTMK